MTRFSHYVLVLSLLAVSPVFGEEGRLSAVRDDVRAVPSSAASKPAASRDEGCHCDHDHWYDGDPNDPEDTLTLWALIGAGVTSPFWGPHAVLDNGFSVPVYFPRHPYDHTDGFLLDGREQGTRVAPPDSEEEVDPQSMPDYMYDELLPETGRPRRSWSGRIDFEYAETFDNLERVGGHLLLTTNRRFGIDAEAGAFREDFPSGRRDELWLGDCNVVFRFAQNPYWQWRTGLGFNWLDDPTRTDFGFNFTYGFDYFPRRPFVITASLDWGTLGTAERFHFRTTAGAVFHHVEAYTGYEYEDIDRTQINALLGGVRFWF